MLNSPSELIAPIGGAIVGMLDTDPRPGVQILNKRYASKPFPRGNFEKEVLKRFVHEYRGGLKGGAKVV